MAVYRIWLRLKNALQRNTDAITSVDKLKAAITTAWTNVPNSYVHWLYNSIPRCLRAVVTSKGNVTKYNGKRITFIVLTNVFLVNVR